MDIHPVKAAMLRLACYGLSTYFRHVPVPAGATW
jgi:hypothetical protein